MRYSYGRALKNWIPIKLQSDHEILCQWLYVGDKKFTDPFLTKQYQDAAVSLKMDI